MDAKCYADLAVDLKRDCRGDTGIDGRSSEKKRARLLRAFQALKMSFYLAASSVCIQQDHD